MCLNTMPQKLRKFIRRGTRIRVLVVDDSVVIRRLVAQTLEGDPAIEVVGTASNGAIALMRIPQLNPDVITLDIEMPDVDGLELLRRMRPMRLDTRVIMFSTLTERGAAATMEALSLGADDYVTKVSNFGSLDKSLAALRLELIPRIKQFFTCEGALPPPGSVPNPVIPPVRAWVGTTPQVFVIGSSTGGPNALGATVPLLPANFPLPVMIVQHMPPVFTRLLAERLNATSQLKVEEAVEGSPVEPGTVLVAPGDHHMRVRRNGTKMIVTLDKGPPENSCRPAVDVLFRSAEEAYGSGVIAAVLTGMGSDGMRGAQVIKAHGGCVIAQDEASSVVWGMPGAVAGAGLADAIVPLDRVIPEILRRVGR